MNEQSVAHREQALPAKIHLRILGHPVTGQKSRMTEYFVAHCLRALPAAGRDSGHYGVSPVEPGESCTPPACCI